MQTHKECRYFINVAGMAYDAFVARKAYESKSFLLKGKLKYLFLVASQLLAFRPVKFKLWIDGAALEDFFYTINVGICKYSGGGMQLVPHADPAGACFGITTAGNISKLAVLVNTPRFFNGHIGSHPKVKLLSGKFLELPAGQLGTTGIEADGEWLGYSPLSIELLPQALKVLVP